MTSHPRGAQIPLILHPFGHATPLGWPVNLPSSTLGTCVWPTDCLHNVRRAACGDVSRFSCYPPCRAYDSFVCLPLPARRCIDGIWTMCISLMCSNFAHPACILPACSAPPYIVAGGRKARPGTEVLKSRGGPARGSDEPSFQRVFVLNHPISDTCL